MPSHLRLLSGALGLAFTILLLAGCDSSHVYPGWYSFNAGKPALPTSGRNGIGNEGPVVLGGTDAAFLAQFQWEVDVFGFIEDPALPRQVLGFNHYPNTFVDGVIAVRDIGDEGHEHQIMTVFLSSPPDQPWSQEEAATYSDAYSPADAVYLHTAPVTNEEGLPGTDKVYASATLAKAFPPSAFVDESGNLVDPGTFNVQCLYPSEGQTDQILSCQLTLGTQQTNHI